MLPSRKKNEVLAALGFLPMLCNNGNIVLYTCSGNMHCWSNVMVFRVFRVWDLGAMNLKASMSLESIVTLENVIKAACDGCIASLKCVSTTRATPCPANYATGDPWLSLDKLRKWCPQHLPKWCQFWKMAFDSPIKLSWSDQKSSLGPHWMTSR